jgi:hypothetical protein
VALIFHFEVLRLIVAVKIRSTIHGVYLLAGELLNVPLRRVKPKILLGYKLFREHNLIGRDIENNETQCA